MEENITSKINSYLTFKIGDEVFAANVAKVLNILELQPITKVPQAPDYMKGVINLRGEVLPVVDSKFKFGLGETEFTNNTCILVLDIEINNEQVHIGALVDSVLEVLELEDKDIEEPPSIGTKYKNEFIEGMAKQADKFVMILNMDLVFSMDELVLIKEKTQEGESIEGDEDAEKKEEKE
jgi:purine-binding chemotaxis protein CheW